MPTEIRLDLKGGTNHKFGDLTICVASSLVSTREAIQAVGDLSSGLAVVNDTCQVATPLVTEITAQLNAWHPLLSRLDALVKVTDMLAEARFILNHPCPMITKYLQTGSPLAWGAVSAAYRVRLQSVQVFYLCAFSPVSHQIAFTHSERDAKVMGLVHTMRRSCSFADEAEELKNRSKRDRDIHHQPSTTASNGMCLFHSGLLQERVLR
jgi:hypothetical protein